MGVKLFNLPDPGEGLVEADIVTWKIKPGDEVKVNDVVVEIETAKSLVELPIPWAGVVVELLVAEGDTVDVGKAIVSIEVAGEESDAPAAPAEPAAAPAAGSSAPDAGEERVANLVGYGAVAGATTRRARRGAPAVAPAPAASAPSPAAAAAPAVPAPAAPAPAAPSALAAPSAPSGKVLAKPPVRKFAKDNGVDLSAITPARADGVITRAEVEAHLAGAPSGISPVVEPGDAAARVETARETRTPVKGVRKMTAQAMVGSAFTAPHVTEFITVDMTRAMELVDRLKADREFKGVKVTPLLVLAKALLVAVKRNPQINATWDEAAQEIVVKHYVNLGIAASTPRGLIVPNIKDADRMTMRELADAMGSLVETARDGKTPPSDMAGGSITITNVGVFGVDNGTPIINPGEAAILCFGAVRKMPWVVTDTAGNDTIVPRQVTQLSLSFDHRLVDGDLGSRFLADVAALMEDPAKTLVWG
ncbi:dihydrolipoamide acetyltransferase family protein [Calidifontibacter indicus]|uniref:Dihydrolipoamide acetyltransferase component of pyruvate dehydrogenase complex n=1 Tax=Calidifontibacter indicus TaxID=419650 RepID=A0A3D9UK24_9MICO|nr:dihydrolipoamide acetyltransferase family protein [Calidifontibacter indicus]REF29802.1 pyruvate dehydrogenase E2 component (dihydrolipoamide acetyltransferase) [Calidifontibacter indicus]